MHALEDKGGDQWAAMYTLTMSEIDEIVDGILNGTVVGVSDGSFKDEFGTVL